MSIVFLLYMSIASNAKKKTAAKRIKGARTKGPRNKSKFLRTQKVQGTIRKLSTNTAFTIIVERRKSFKNADTKLIVGKY